MTEISAEQVRAFLLEHLCERISAGGHLQQEIPDNFDLFTAGIIDSFGIMELISAIEKKFGVEVDLEMINAEDLTVIGPLTRYIADYIVKGQAIKQSK